MDIAIGSWAHVTLPVLAMALSVVIVFHVGSHPTLLLFCLVGMDDSLKPFYSK